MKTLSYLASLANLDGFIWKIFIPPRQNKVRSHLGRLVHFSYEQIFLQEFLKEGEPTHLTLPAHLRMNYS